MKERTDFSKYTSRQHLNIVFKRRGMNSTIEALLIVGEAKKNIILEYRDRRKRNRSENSDRESDTDMKVQAQEESDTDIERNHKSKTVDKIN